MNIARVLYPVEVLGPGKRLGIWTCGCDRHCPGCSNPELWDLQPRYLISVSDFEKLLRQFLRDHRIDGITITGGDPFYQAEELNALLPVLRSFSDDILVYTGYTYEELKVASLPAVATCLSNISVLVDGPYIEELNDGALMRGSSNQRIIYLDPAIEPKYAAYLDNLGNNKIQNFTSEDGIISVGIHQADFQKRIADETRKRGIMIDG